MHHSVVDGEMDSIVSFRFHWERDVQALVGTAIGPLNHANLDLDLGHGRWRYVLNRPRMHLWHHAADGPARNFGIIFSAWDWIFGTAHLPDHPPARLGFDGDAALPRGFLGLTVWPALRLHTGAP